MRVLLLRRHHQGGLGAHVDELAVRLPHHGASAIVEDAGTWMPNEAGGRYDRDTTRMLRDRAESVDLVHAFGPRAAWACAEAFGDRESWVYTLIDPPKTLAGPMIERLNLAALGLAGSHLTLNRLVGAGVSGVEALYPGIAIEPSPTRTREEARNLLGLAEDELVVGAMSDHGLMAAFERTETGKLLMVSTTVTPPESKRIIVKDWMPRPEDAILASDLWVVPDRDRGYARNAAKAMALGVPVLLRAGFREMVDEDQSGYLFVEDEALPARIDEILGMPLSREVVGRAGTLRARERFDVDATAARIADLYRDVLTE
ncbi:MAG: glycosyltransferase family 4 protein [Methanoregulaceae archaeon]|nr:glycosyltransferase family 4 protein [Methanoregulaceae archaeon]